MRGFQALCCIINLNLNVCMCANDLTTVATNRDKLKWRSHLIRIADADDSKLSTVSSVRIEFLTNQDCCRRKIWKQNVFRILCQGKEDNWVRLRSKMRTRSPRSVRAPSPSASAFPCRPPDHGDAWHAGPSHCESSHTDTRHDTTRHDILTSAQQLMASH